MNTRMIQRLGTIVGALLLLQGTARAGDTEQPSGVKASDSPDPASTAKGTPPAASRESDVLNGLHRLNQAEIAVGKLAEDRAQSDQVKDYAKHLVNDHTDADSKVMYLAKKHKIELRTPEPDKSKLHKLQ